MRATVRDTEAVDYFSVLSIPYPIVIIKNPEKAALDGESAELLSRDIAKKIKSQLVNE